MTESMKPMRDTLLSGERVHGGTASNPRSVTRERIRLRWCTGVVDASVCTYPIARGRTAHWRYVASGLALPSGVMDRDALRAVQAPLKDRYRDEPEAALVTLTAQGTLDDGIACSVQTGRALATAGLHPATGGDGLQLCSGDMLLEALVACAGVTLKAVATALEIALQGGTITAEGVLDFRGTLGVDRAAPVGFKEIALRFDLDAPGADAEQLATLMKLTERYCVVLQTLRSSPELRLDHDSASL